MITQLFTTFIRQFKKQPLFYLINLFGLCLGFASSLLILFFIRHELSYDQFHDRHEDKFRITNHFRRASGEIHWNLTPPALVPTLRNGAFPEIKYVTQLRFAGVSNRQHLFTHIDQSIYESNIFYADSSFLNIFNFSFIEGEPATALDEPNSIVLSKSMATRLFGEQHALGKTIRMNQGDELEVTGVLENIPSNSHLQFEGLVSFGNYQVPSGNSDGLSSWRWIGFLTYVQLHKGSDKKKFEEKLTQLYLDNVNNPVNLELKVYAQAFKDIYLKSDGIRNQYNIAKKGQLSNIYGLATIAILILLIACFNFLNLSIALSTKRYKEISIKKIIGASKKILLVQHQSEHLILIGLALLLSIPVVLQISVLLENQLDWPLQIKLSQLWPYIPTMAIIAFILSLLIGFYPSILLSRFNPKEALKGNINTSFSGFKIRRVLVFLQFCITIALIFSAIVVNQQIDFMQRKELGYDKEKVVVLNGLADEMSRSYENLKSQMEKNPQVKAVSKAKYVFNGVPSVPIVVDGTGNNNALQVAAFEAHYDFLETMDIPLKSGRFFSKNFPRDSAESIILNEKAVKLLNLEAPLGTRVTLWGERKSVVIGVLEDFHYTSLHQGIDPMVMFMPFTPVRKALVKLNSGNLSEQIATLKADWKTIFPSTPLNYTFLDENINQLYFEDQRYGSLIKGFSILAIVIACLGLYGLAAFIVQTKLKEIGIRKVLGASIKDIWLFINNPFILLLLLANLIALIPAWFLTNIWLSNFAYRLPLQLSFFVLPGLIVILIALFTLSIQAFKGALSNPVEVLRQE